jgi:hypothetical protein
LGARELLVESKNSKMILRLLLALIAIPLGLDLYLPVPEDNPITQDKVALDQLGLRHFDSENVPTALPPLKPTVYAARKFVEVR